MKGSVRNAVCATAWFLGSFAFLAFLGACLTLELRAEPGAGAGGDAAADAPVQAQPTDGSSATGDADTPDSLLTPEQKYGDGHRGALKVDAAQKIVNVYASVSAAAQAGAKTIVVANSAGIVSGDLVLVVRTAGLSPGPSSGDGAPIDLAQGALGRWELARLSGVAGSQLVLAGPLANDVAAGAQVVTVPEYTDVEIPAGTSLTAPPWDGLVGGILAFFATGTVTNIGGIDVSGDGFRAGNFKRGGTGPCTTLDLAPPAGAQKGEGLVSGSYGDAIGGYGNIANGAGGGNCVNGGGGGGGNAGPGGKGGAVDGTDHGGRGGAAVVFDPLKRLSLGGGGGAGQGLAVPGTGGGRGGGAVLIHAHDVLGAGYIRANGQSAATSGGDSSGDTGAGGGGAGGTVHLRVAGALKCGGVEANGGAGGSSNGPNNVNAAPGGGGGGGRVVLQAASFTCPGGATAGVAGVWRDGVNHQGAEPSSGSDPAHVGTVDVVATGF